MHSSLKSLQSGKSGPASSAKPASPGARLLSIDALRGLVMIIMALDHVRDFFHADAMLFSPTDLSRTTPVLFFTRWITHFCLPVFMFAAGMGIYLYGRSRSKGQLSRFLWTRGLWFIVLELTVMRFAYNFNFSLRFLILLLILWIFGICMLAMAALVYMPMRWLAVLSVAVVLLHNCLDGISAAQFGSAAWVWNFLHQPGVIPVAGKLVLVTYTFLPWIGVMAAGYCFARVFQLEPEARRRIMLKLGLAMTIAFIALRALNHYGDPAPWTHQKSALFTVLSFLNCTKYPGSLDFLLMTLGPALLVLAWFDRLHVQAGQSAGGLWARANVLFRSAFLFDPCVGSAWRVVALWRFGCAVHFQSAAFHGRAARAVSGELWL